MILNSPTISGSLTVTGNILTSGSITLSGSVASASNAVAAQTASSADNFLVRNTLTAQTLVVQTVTSSVIYSSGSNVFGNNIANTQIMTGSVTMTGSLAVVTNGTKFQVTSTGVNLGNALTDSHVISGSLIVNPSGLFVSSSGRVGIGTTSPLTILDIRQSATGTATVNSAFRDSSTNGNALQIWNGNNEARLRAIYYGTPSDQSITFYTITSAGSEAERMRITHDGKVGVGTSTPSAPLEISYNNTSYTTTPILSLNNTNINGQTHINFLITGSLVGKIRSDYEGGMIYVTNNRGLDRSHYFLVNGDVGTGSLAMAISASGRIGMGTSSPSARLDIQGGSDGDGMISMGSNSVSGILNSPANIYINADSDNNASGVIVLGFNRTGYTGGTEAVRILEDGYLRLASRGIQFNGDTADVNSLDDYEEGTFTPIITGASGSPTYSAQAGWYTKVGRVVNIAWFISFSKNTLSGTLRLTNLPFTLLNGPGNYYPQGTVLLDNLSTATNNITLQGANNSTGADFIGGNGSTSTHTGLPISVLGAGSMECRGTLTYFSA